jgi:hypothetical protein
VIYIYIYMSVNKEEKKVDLDVFKCKLPKSRNPEKESQQEIDERIFDLLPISDAVKQNIIIDHLVKMKMRKKSISFDNNIVVI